MTVGAASPARPFDLVIFDLDDTLIDFHRDVRLARLESFTGLPAAFIHGAITAGLAAIQCHDADQVRAELRHRGVID